MSILFYRHDPGDPPVMAAEVAPGMAIHSWAPASDGFPGGSSRTPINVTWWLLSTIGLFANRHFAEISIQRNDAVLHRLIVTPRWYRFPFMALDDLQVGDLWTRPDARRQRLARAAMAEAHRLCGGDTRRLWYVVDDDNAGSIALVESCGYRLVGSGRRTRPAGIALLGRYKIDSRA